VVTLRSVRIPSDGAAVDGDLHVPDDAPTVVVFAHGSGSSRHSPRNRRVAAMLQARGLATLLLDLLTTEEERVDLQSGELRFDIDLLAGRVVHAIDWLETQPDTARLTVGCFGASTGAAGALVAAAERGDRVASVVSRGGRPDLAGDALPRVRAPTLLIVGGHDHVVIDLNRRAAAQLTAEHNIEIVPGATHLFEERGALERVAELAADWFTGHPGTRDTPWSR
jgi:putative phosphoribosyl transferase